MRALFTATLLLAICGTAPHAGAGTRSGALAVDAIRGSIAAQNCQQAVDRLKSGLKNEYPEVFLLAGSMYENGICVRRDWDRAVTFYVQAHDAGEKDGAARIAAGYADPANGPTWRPRSGGRPRRPHSAREPAACRRKRWRTPTASSRN